MIKNINKKMGQNSNIHFTTVYWHFAKALNISGNELLLFCLIYAFSLKQKDCLLSISEMAELLNISSQSVVKILQRLEKEKLIKKQSFFKFKGASYSYSVNYENNTVIKESLKTEIKESLKTEIKESLKTEIKESLKTTSIKKTYNNKEEKEKEKEKEKKESSEIEESSKTEDFQNLKKNSLEISKEKEKICEQKEKENFADKFQRVLDEVVSSSDWQNFTSARFKEFSFEQLQNLYAEFSLRNSESVEFSKVFFESDLKQMIKRYLLNFLNWKYSQHQEQKAKNLAGKKPSVTMEAYELLQKQGINLK